MRSVGRVRLRWSGPPLSVAPRPVTAAVLSTRGSEMRSLGRVPLERRERATVPRVDDAATGSLESRVPP